MEDEDDWDLGDKIFQWGGFPNDNFELKTNGSIIMRQGTDEGNYELKFVVTEEAESIPRHTVEAKVFVSVKNIPEEAVFNSGSIRLNGTTIEEFVEKPENSKSKKDLLQQHISKIFNTSLENVDVFTVLKSPTNSSLVDVRFSAHGSPYYSPEKLNNKASEQQKEVCIYIYVCVFSICVFWIFTMYYLSHLYFSLKRN